MNEKIFYYGLLELGISILIGICVMYITYRLINKLIKKKYDIKNNNTAYAIFSSGVLFSVAYLISGIKSPILNSVRMIQDQANYDGSILFDGFKYTGLFLFIIIITIALVNFLSIFLFTIMTRNIKEFEEIKNNNIAVSIITTIVIVSISLLVKDSLYLILEAFVPYPEMPSFLN
tara:strand:- start:325 stop:849 length:525 start_codon:yes stop_codon:yes gene_type:complete